MSTPEPVPIRRRGGPRRRGARLAALALGLLGPPLLCELGLRLVGFSHRPLEAPVVVWDVARDAAMAAGEDVHEAHPPTLWRPRPGAPVPDVEGERVNALGLRGPLPPEDVAAGPAVAFLGDSSTFGFAIPFAESYPGRLARALGPEVGVLPAGVIGYTLVQGRARYRELLRPLDPEVVVLAFGAVNEHFPSDVGGDRERIAILEARARRDAAPWRRLARGLRVVQVVEALRERVRGGRDRAVAAWTERKLAYDAAFARRGELDFEGPRRVEPEEFAAELRAFATELAADGVRPVVVGMPRRADFEQRMPVLAVYDARLRATVAELGLPFLDARALFREDPRGEEALLLDTVHPTPAGHALLAAALEPLVERALAGATGGERPWSLSGTAGRE